MNVRLALVGVALLGALGLSSSCHFEPDLSRFQPCAEDGSCGQGFTCLPEMRRCLPDCGAQENCPPPPDASTDGGRDGGADAGLPLSLATRTLALAVEKVPYSVELQAQGGTPPYGFRATSPLPQGLTLDGGVLSGTPSTPGTFRVAVEVSDSDTPPVQASAAYDLRVRPQLRVAGPDVLMDGYQGDFYTEKVSAFGGTPPYTFKLESGSLASGLKLLEDGSVTGTPSVNGTYAFTVQVTDADPQQPQTAALELALTISGAPLFLTISNKSVPDGRVGTPYQYTLRTAPDAADSWRFKEGVLPRGIGFYPDIAVLSGTPNEPGSFTFVISASSGPLGSTERSFTMEVH